MTQDRKNAIIDELVEHAGAAVEHYAPALGAYAVAVAPLVKKGLRYVVKLIREKGHEDAERILDALLSPAARMAPIPADGPEETTEG